MPVEQYVEIAGLCFAAAVAGAINSVAGGGTLLTFPALIAALGGSAEAAVWANATSTVALFPGSLAGMAGYRRELLAARSWIKLLLLPSLTGGLIGSLLLMRLPAESFKALIPWLLLTAATLFWLQPRLSRRLAQESGENADRPQRVLLVSVFQLLVAIYGGYFGAGIGILMLTALGLMGLHDIHRMNGLKTLFASVINGVAVVVFIASGKVHWPLAIMMALAAIIGGYGGAHVARRLDRNFVRRVVVFIGLSLAAYYLYQQWHSHHADTRRLHSLEAVIRPPTVVEAEADHSAPPPDDHLRPSVVDVDSELLEIQGDLDRRRARQRGLTRDVVEMIRRDLSHIDGEPWPTTIKAS